jgi:hypothetical protein
MALSIAPTQNDVQTALKQFLTSILPPDVEVRAGLANRVPEPKGSRYVVMTVLRFVRLSTNLDSYQDVVFTASIGGNLMTVTAVRAGEILVGANIFSEDIPAGVTILNQVSGDEGGVGVYTISSSMSVDSETISAGGYTLQQNSEAVFQLDFHSATNTAGDLAQTVSTAFRDELATDFFSALSAPLNAVVPLYADDPQMHPFTSGESQYEWAFFIEAHLQVNQSLRAPMQFFDSVDLNLVDVDVVFPV